MKTLAKWTVALVFVVGSGIALAGADTNICDDKSGANSQKTGAAKKNYTCTCDSPCNGSKTCTNGCYAFCEENPGGSGRYVCIKGCASEAPTVKGKKLDPNKKYASVNLSMPRERVMSLMMKLYDKKALRPIALKADVSEPVNIRLHHADMAMLIRELER